MKTFIAFLSAAALLATACTQNKPKEATDSETTSECYLAVSNADSAFLSFENVDGKVNGKLAFNFSEKDDSEGVIKGEFKGDTLFVDYTFTAEGVLSKNPLAFLRSGNNLEQGHGVILTYLGKTYFKDHSEIKFEDGFLFEPTECE